MKPRPEAPGVDAQGVPVYRGRRFYGPSNSVGCDRAELTYLRELRAWHDERERLADDHALVAAAFASGGAGWEPFIGAQIEGELTVNSLRYATRLDEFGVPTLNDLLRGELRKALAR